MVESMRRFFQKLFWRADRCRWCGDPIRKQKPRQWQHMTGWDHVFDEDAHNHYAQPPNPSPPPGPACPPPLKQLMWA